MTATVNAWTVYEAAFVAVSLFGGLTLGAAWRGRRRAR